MPKKYIDLETLKYILYDIHNLENLLTAERFQDHDIQSLDLFIDSVKELSDRELYPYFQEMDAHPAYHKDERVIVHKQVQTMMQQGGEMGLISGTFNYENGGLQIPFLAHTAATYILDAANNHLPGYLGLTQGAAELIIEFASQELNDTYVQKMIEGIWGGTMCLTEPQAGSSLSDIVTKATPTDDDSYKITGQKIFISGGDYQYAENIVHLVLARVEGAPKGTKGISLFVVPKNRLNKEGTLTQNDVTTVADFQKMIEGTWGGTMCLTEPQAGSSLSDIVTKATPTDDDSYKITGQKIFISGGDYQYAENIVHLVLARVEGAPKGTKGISLFVVPKNRLNKDGTFTPNDVTTVADFQKMGQRGYCTTHLGFGDKNNDCKGWLVGKENYGLKYMFLMMNAARIGVGRGAAAIAMAAYRTSLQYANERPQGRKLTSSGKKNIDEQQTLIIEHPDVRRMLLLQKSIVEGSMSLVFLAAKYYDIIHTTTDEKEKARYNLLLEMIIPMVKTYPSEAGAVAVNNGVQVLGGYGFCTDFILQQYYRDIRIFSLYEGTTGIQSQDLLGRKVPMENGKGLELLASEIMKTITAASKHKSLQKYAGILGEKLQLSQKVVAHLLPFAQKGNFERYLADANLFMEFLSIVTIAWLWLEMALDSANQLENEQKKHDDTFYQSKIHTMKFYFAYEVPKTTSLAESLLNNEETTIKKSTEYIY